MTGLEALPFLGETGHVISLVGGGGKTTLLYALARWYSAQGQRVLVSTTTHIQRPDANYAPDEAARDALWQAGTYAVAGVPAEGGKLTMPPYLDDWMAEATLFCLRLTARSAIPARLRPLMSRCSCGQATSCWRQPGCRRWGNHCKTSASASKRPAPCWPCRPRRP